MSDKLTYKVLAVDDNDAHLEGIRHCLEDRYEIVTAASAGEALGVFSSFSPQVIIVNQYLNDTGGIEFLQQLRSINATTIRILITANGESNDAINNAVSSGDIYRYICRPIDIGDLQMTVANGLQLYESQQAESGLVQELKKKNEQLEYQNRNLSIMLDKFDDIQDRLFEMERFSAIGQMASFIIHDMKQPLDLIQSSVEALIHLQLTDDEKNDISEIVQFEMQRFTQMIYEILDYTRGKISMNFDIIPISRLFHRMDREILRYLTNYQIEYKGLLFSEEATVNVDATKFLRVPMNLIKNAIEALEGHSGIHPPSINLRVICDKDWVQFSISDNGPGIPEKIHEKLFDPFITINKSSGIGLGLAIVKRIIDEHKGRIWFKSSPESGTEFTFRLRNYLSSQEQQQ